MESKKIFIIGGGAAGFFAALTCAAHYPQHQVKIFEKSNKLLSKVKVSGGGRCNVTHACFQANALSKHYPRGEKQLKQAFQHFMPQDMITWLEKRNVILKTEGDGRIFPVTDDSQTIIDCFLKEAKSLNIEIRTQTEVKKIIPQSNGGFELLFLNGHTEQAHKIIIATGGSPKESGLDWLKELGHQIETPIPSLFTFNMPQNPIIELMGVAVEQASVSIQGTKLKQAGAVLITHWGMSGPAILKLSAWGARILHQLNYQFTIQINWLHDKNEDTLRTELMELKATNKQKIKNFSTILPKRLWAFLLEKAKIDEEKTWQEIAKNDLNRLIAILTNDQYPVSGKTTFKEEFVTCGGVSLQNVDFATIQSKVVPNLYFAGEVLDIDGVTGGFNFQAAWTTGYLAGLAAGI